MTNLGFAGLVGFAILEACLYVIVTNWGRESGLMSTAILGCALVLGLYALINHRPLVMAVALIVLVIAIVIMCIDLATTPPRDRNLL